MKIAQLMTVNVAGIEALNQAQAEFTAEFRRTRIPRLDLARRVAVLTILHCHNLIRINSLQIKINKAYNQCYQFEINTRLEALVASFRTIRL